MSQMMQLPSILPLQVEKRGNEKKKQNLGQEISKQMQQQQQQPTPK
jgi:hypothetical protein